MLVFLIKGFMVLVGGVLFIALYQQSLKAIPGTRENRRAKVLDRFEEELL